MGIVKFTSEGYALNKEVNPDKEIVSTTDLHNFKGPFKAGIVTIGDSTVILRVDQSHLVVAVGEMLSVGSFTSKKTKTVEIADHQPSGDQKPDGTPKGQFFKPFTEPMEVPKESFEEHAEATCFVQDPIVIKNIQSAIEHLRSVEPISYESTGVTEEGLKAIMALREIKDAERH